MGRRGPRPLDANVRRLRGLPSKPSKVPDALPAIPRPPSTLKGEGLKEWKRVAEPLFKLGRLAEIDRAVLHLYCRWHEHAMIIDGKLADNHTAIGQKGNEVVSPLWREFRDATATVLKLQKELGLTPDSRLRQSSIPVEPEELDELESILSRPIR